MLGTTGVRPAIFTRISCCICLFLECGNGRCWGLQVSGQQYLPESVVVFVCFWNVVMADAGDYRCQASNYYQNKLLYLSVSRMW